MKNKVLIIKYSIFAAIGVMLVFLDQVTKSIMVTRLKYTGASSEIIKGVLNFTYVRNEGAAFGMMQGQKVVFVILTMAVFAAAFWYFKKYRPSHPIELSAAALILSGALGNLIDRLAFGYVRDFIEVRFINFPVFNVADCAICVGALLVVIYAFMGMRKTEE